MPVESEPIAMLAPRRLAQDREVAPLVRLLDAQAAADEEVVGPVERLVVGQRRERDAVRGLDGARRRGSRGASG